MNVKPDSELTAMGLTPEWGKYIAALEYVFMKFAGHKSWCDLESDDSGPCPSCTCGYEAARREVVAANKTLNGRKL